jgi:hypothetical protein
MDDFYELANRCEAGLWFVVAAALFVHSWRSPVRLRKICWTLTGAFLLFGVSDLIEAETGAWWRPLWLLALKGGCLLVIVLGFWQYQRAAKRGR